MTPADLLERQTRRQFRRLKAAVLALPEDKLDWKPAPDARSALDQLQECATVGDEFPDLYTERVLRMPPEKYAAWRSSRSRVTDRDELLRMLEESIEREIAKMRAVSPEEYEMPMNTPWAEPDEVIDTMGYSQWNMTYHEGQINYIASLIEKGD